MKIGFISSSPGFQGKYPVNLFFHPEWETGKPAMVGTSGLVEQLVLAPNKEIRNMRVFKGALYVVAGNEVYKINSNLDSTLLGTVGSSSGFISMAHNHYQLMIADRSSVLLSEGGVLQGVTGYSGGSLTVACQDEMFIVHRPDTQEVYASDIADGKTWDAVAGLGGKTGRPDNIVAVIGDRTEVWLLGSESTEIGMNRGLAVGFPWERVGLVEIGCAAPGSVFAHDHSIMWLNNYKQLVRTEGYTPIVISPPQVGMLIANYDRVDDCIGFTFMDRAVPFCAWTFPSANKTWVYGPATHTWHQWSSGVYGARHRANCCAEWNGKYWVGDYENGKLYTLEPTAYSDAGAHIFRQRTVPPIDDEAGRRIFFDELKLIMKTGVGKISGHGIGGVEAPMGRLDWSDDGGATWSDEVWASMGKIGEHGIEVRWPALGSAVSRIFRWTTTEEVEVVLYDAVLRAASAVY